MKDNSSRQILLSVLGVAILVVAVVGVSFAAFTYTGTGQKENTISTGSITMNYTEGDKGISITNAMPVSDATGKAITAESAGTAGTAAEGAGVFDFNVSAKITGTVTINYDIMAVKQTEDSQLDEQYAKLYLEKSTTSATEGYDEITAPATYNDLTAATGASTAAGKALPNAKLLHSDSFDANATHYYRLRMWVDESYVVEGTSKTFTVKIDVYGEAAK